MLGQRATTVPNSYRLHPSGKREAKQLRQSHTAVYHRAGRRGDKEEGVTDARVTTENTEESGDPEDFKWEAVRSVPILSWVRGRLWHYL